MTPLGHASISYLLGQSTSKTKLLFPIVLMGILPDIDVLFIGFDWFNDYHRVVTHNLCFGLVCTAILAWYNQIWPYWYWLFLAFCGHLLVDSMLDANPSNGIGVAFLYPFSKQVFSPYNFHEAYISNITWREPWAMIRQLMGLLYWEVPFILLALWQIFRNKKPKTP